MKLVIGGYAQGKFDYASNTYSDYEIWNKFHRFVKEELLSGKGKEEIIEAVDKKIAQNPRLVIISDEIGNGVVPMDKEDRIWRETTGRVLTYIASKADSVERIVCGIPVKIK